MFASQQDGNLKSTLLKCSETSRDENTTLVTDMAQTSSGASQDRGRMLLLAPRGCADAARPKHEIEAGGEKGAGVGLAHIHCGLSRRRRRLPCCQSSLLSGVVGSGSAQLTWVKMNSLDIKSISPSASQMSWFKVDTSSCLTTFLTNHCHKSSKQGIYKRCIRENTRLQPRAALPAKPATCATARACARTSTARPTSGRCATGAAGSRRSDAAFSLCCLSEPPRVYHDLAEVVCGRSMRRPAEGGSSVQRAEGLIKVVDKQYCDYLCMD
ncbi:hypothetical protein GH733_005916 [Mirounga leonina]|nr:hypothetical protein GH733_005916 [Mirounga leonina]